MRVDSVPARATRGILVATAAALLLCSCDDEFVFGILEGSVTLNASSAPGVIVRVTGTAEAVVETGALGEYGFELVPGEYTVTLTDGLPSEAECLPGRSQNVTIVEDVVEVLDFTCGVVAAATTAPVTADGS